MKKIDWLKVWMVIFGSILGIGIICAYGFMPLALVKALNVLFHLGIPYNAETYCMSAILILLFGNPNFSFSDSRKDSTPPKGKKPCGCGK